MEEKESCETCRFRKDHCCVRYPPVPVYDEDTGMFCYWPEIALGDWCGEYKRKE
jgi:hypothetical protein